MSNVVIHGTPLGKAPAELYTYLTFLTVYTGVFFVGAEEASNAAVYYSVNEYHPFDSRLRLCRATRDIPDLFSL